MPATGRDVTLDILLSLLVEYGDPLTRESYLNINSVDEDGLDTDQESELLA